MNKETHNAFQSWLNSGIVTDAELTLIETNLETAYHVLDIYDNGGICSNAIRQELQKVKDIRRRREETAKPLGMAK